MIRKLFFRIISFIEKYGIIIIMAKQYRKNNNLKETAPYNICDRFCARCKYQLKCKVFQDANAAQIQHIIEKRNPHNIKAIFQDLERGFKHIKATLKTMAREERINIEEVIVNKDSDKQYRLMEMNIKKTLLYRQSQKFTRDADRFLKRLFILAQQNNPFLLPAFNQEINDLVFYFGALQSKVYRALSRLHDPISIGNETNSINANREACIALNASLVCEKAISAMMEEVKELYIEGLQLLTMLSEIRAEVKKNFPAAESFRDEIIFNTNF